jgi:hypothetical protein
VVNVPVLWAEVEEQLLSGTLPSEIYKTLGHDFYSTFEFKIMTAHYHFLKETYGFIDEQIFKSGKMNKLFILK